VTEKVFREPEIWDAAILCQRLRVMEHLNVSNSGVPVLLEACLWPRIPMPVRSVLVVDDNPLVRQAVCELFTREGTLKYAERLKMGERQSKRLSCSALT
jgi:hypothetical protein